MSDEDEEIMARLDALADEYRHDAVLRVIMRLVKNDDEWADAAHTWVAHRDFAAAWGEEFGDE